MKQATYPNARTDIRTGIRTGIGIDVCTDKLKILADSTRFGVIQLLQSGPKTVGVLIQSLGVEQSLLSHHLRVLREAKFVTMERIGKQVLYRLDPNVVTDANGLNLDCCTLSFR